MISTQFLEDIAKYVDSRIAKVVINGTYEITQFEVKQVTDSTLAMRYIVPASEVSVITMIELKDEDGNVISSNSVNIPITADQVMIQAIEVIEVVNGG